MVTVVRRMTDPEADSAPPYGEELLQAIDVLTADGTSFTELSIARIAKEAGISRATFYLHYKDKVELIERLGLLATLDVLTAINLWVPYAEKANWADLRLAMATILDMYEKNRVIIDVLVELAGYDETIRDFYFGILDDLTDQIKTGLRKVMKAGVAHPDLSVHYAGYWVRSAERNNHFFAGGRAAARAPWLLDVMIHDVWTSVYHPDVTADKKAKPTSQGKPG